MAKFLLATFMLIVVLLVGGGIFLANWDIPAPTTQVEKVVPDARFPK